VLEYHREAGKALAGFSAADSAGKLSQSQDIAAMIQPLEQAEQAAADDDMLLGRHGVRPDPPRPTALSGPVGLPPALFDNAGCGGRSWGQGGEIMGSIIIRTD
jgi:hypothetical protein